jgi:predicted dithiol-disulfide oxidoreductase (DUF899 family)
MNYAKGVAVLADHRNQIATIRAQMRKVQAEMQPQEVEDYVFQTPAGEVRLSELFGGKDDLFIVHNMGTSCAYCTLWADGYSGIYKHLADRAAFVVSSPDAPKVQSAFAAKRGWTFPMVSHKGTTFAADMGYIGVKGGFMPGLSVFQKRGGHVVRVSDTQLGPGDDFCALWHILDMLPAGPDGWQPKFDYPQHKAGIAKTG